MTATQYRTARRARGTVQDVAPKIGVHITTLQRRERGDIPITKEAELVLLSLPLLPEPVPAHTLGRKPGYLSKKSLSKNPKRGFNCPATLNKPAKT